MQRNVTGNTMNNVKVQQARRLFEEIAEIAQDASLTGMLKGGQARLAIRYNTLVSQCEEAGLLPAELAGKLDSDAAYEAIAIEARLSAASLDSPKDESASTMDFAAIVRIAPFIGSQELGELVRDQMRAGINIGVDALTAVAPFLDQTTLNSIVREHIAPKSPTPPKAPEPPVAPAPPVDPVAERIQALATRLSEPSLSADERVAILREISELGSVSG